MAETTLAVLLSNRTVGTLQQNRSGRVIWTPDPDWSRQGQRPRLGLDFLRNIGPISSGTGLPPWFENLLPERGSALRTALCDQRGLAAGNSIGLLGALGEDLPGGVRLRRLANATSSTPALAGPSTAPWSFSLAGMQLKLSMGQIGNRFVIPAANEDGRWIVKLPGAAFPDLPAVEHATMQWARAAGLEVPKNQEISVEQLEGVPESWRAHSKTCFLIERFDRRRDGTRIHHEDLCQALGVRPEHKLGNTGPNRYSLDGVLRLVADTCGEVQARHFARRIGFVIASGNGDAHLKNWSFEWGSAARPRLSPCYDQVCTIRWPQFGWGNHKRGPTMGLGLGRVRRFGQLTGEVLKHHSKAAGIPWAVAEIQDGAQTAIQVWPQVSDLAPQPMQEQLAIHWRRVPMLARLSR